MCGARKTVEEAVYAVSVIACLLTDILNSVVDAYVVCNDVVEADVP